ncbi:MAG: hypothetical protein L0Y72_21420 [Gemmataceae bacterium]|nr:hypothetical protein [Gemmataceae bacterium]
MLEKGVQLSDAQLRRYIRVAMRRCEKMAEKYREKAFARHLMQRQHLFARAMESGDLRTAHALLRDEAELLKLYDGDLLARVAALEARLATKAKTNGVHRHGFASKN